MLITLMASGVNNSRLTSMTYPNGRIVRTEYNTGLDANISRPSFIADGTLLVIGTHLEEYQYLGLGTVVARNHPEPGLNLTLISPTNATADAGDKYVGLDRFGRVVDQRWVIQQTTPVSGTADSGTTTTLVDSPLSSTNNAYNGYTLNITGGTDAGQSTTVTAYNGSTHTLTLSPALTSAPDTTSTYTLTYSHDADRDQYTYDADSNRVTKQWSAAGTVGGLDEAYSYDGLNRLTKVNRGTLVSGAISDASATYSQRWDGSSDGTNTSGLDALGNWKGVYNDPDGGAGAGAAIVTRHTSNSQNQITSISGGTTTLTYDAAGNTTTDETGDKYTYDAWNRTKAVKTSAGTVKVTYTIDPLGRRVSQAVNAGVGTGDSADLYYSANWQVVEERAVSGTTATHQNVWSGVYVDALVERDNSNGITVGGLDSSFGTSGEVTVDTGATDDDERAVLQSDGKLVAVGIANGNVEVIRLNPDGSLDSGFGTSGKVQTDFGTSGDRALDVYIQDDNKILIVGANTGGNVIAARYLTDGTLDTTFSPNVVAGTSDVAGTYIKDFGGDEQGASVTEDSAGNVIIAGYAGNDALVMRLTNGGVLDTTFNTTGYKIFDVGAGSTFDHLYDVQVLANGNILSVGETTGGGNQAVLVELTPTGGFVSGFGTSGITLTDFGGSQDKARRARIDQQGRIVIGGTGGANVDLLVARYTAAGMLDTANFSDGTNSGYALISYNASTAEAGDELQIDGNGRIVIAGTAVNAASGTSGNDFAVARVLPSGLPDNSFDSNGRAAYDLGTNTNDQGKALVVLPDNRILVGGQTTAGTGSTNFGFAMIGGGDSRNYAIQDANYNVTAVADAQGKIVDRDLYSAYGDQTVLNADGTVDKDNTAEANMPFGYQGLRKDVNSGNWNARNRDLRSPLGAWTQGDPSGYPDGGNRYEDERTSPIMMLDSVGLAGERAGDFTRPQPDGSAITRRVTEDTPGKVLVDVPIAFDNGDKGRFIMREQGVFSVDVFQTRNGNVVQKIRQYDHLKDMVTAEFSGPECAKCGVVQFFWFEYGTDKGPIGDAIKFGNREVSPTKDPKDPQVYLDGDGTHAYGNYFGLAIDQPANRYWVVGDHVAPVPTADIPLKGGKLYVETVHFNTYLVCDGKVKYGVSWTQQRRWTAETGVTVAIGVIAQSDKAEMQAKEQPLFDASDKTLRP